MIFRQSNEARESGTWAWMPTAIHITNVMAKATLYKTTLLAASGHAGMDAYMLCRSPSIQLAAYLGLTFHGAEIDVRGVC